MALLRAKGRQTTAVNREAEGADVYIKALRDGTMTTAAFFHALALEGRVFCVNSGTVTTVTTFAAGDIVATTPDLLVLVPAGTAIMPINFALQMQAFGTHLIFETVLTMGTGGSYTSGGTAITPTNIRTDKPYSSNCTVYSDVAVAVGQTANVTEIWRDGLQLAVTKTTATATIGNADFNKFSWSAVESGITPLLIGSAQLTAHAASQAGTGFMTLVYAELPAAAFV